MVSILMEMFGVRPLELARLVGTVGRESSSRSAVCPRIMLRALSAARRELAYTGRDVNSKKWSGAI